MPNQPTRTVAYGRVHDLQHVSVTQLTNTNGYWVIYIHGGAWRDPTVTADSFKATEDILRKTPGLPIAGFASISYRLSAHPNHPQDPTRTGTKEYRDATHPDHIRDVEAALAFLQNTYAFGGRYILLGHSCGATLAFQAVMGAVAGHREQAFKGALNNTDVHIGPVSTSPGPLPPRLTVQPTAIVGVAGIYDLRRLRDRNAGIDAYREFIAGAFGDDELLWDAVSPAQMVGSRGVEGGWRSGRLAVLAQSKEDELVDGSQVEAMEEALRRWENVEAQVPVHELSTKDRRVRVLSISGEHDEAWEKGDQLARAVIYAFEELQAMGLTT